MTKLLPSETTILAKIVPGYGIASGKTKDSRFPSGTLALQMPFFESSGFDFQLFHQGTLNLDFSPYSFVLGRPSYSFSDFKWCEYFPSENFSFFACCLINPLDEKRKEYPSFVYWPHPSTKPGFEQPSGILEILAPYIPELQYGMSLVIKSETNIISFEEKVSLTG